MCLFQTDSNGYTEGFVFGVGVLIVAFEYVRQTKKETAKKLQEKEEKYRIRGLEEDERATFKSNVGEKIESLNEQVELLTRRLKLLEDQVADRIDHLIGEEKRRQASRGFLSGFFSSPPAAKVKVVSGRQMA